jgi:hypothetical protein
MDATFFSTKGYENEIAFSLPKNKPNQTQFQTPHQFSRYRRCLPPTSPNPAPQSPSLTKPRQKRQKSYESITLFMPNKANSS